jgi:hypothetical protein
MCALHGHDSTLAFVGNRMFLRCASCGHDSTGWELPGHAPRHRFDGDPRRHRIVTPRLVLRKTA